MKYTIEPDMTDRINSPVLMQEEQELAVANQNMMPDGHFRCRFSGCEKHTSSSMSILIPITFQVKSIHIRVLDFYICNKFAIYHLKNSS